MCVLPIDVINLIYTFNPCHRADFAYCLKRIALSRSFRGIHYEGVKTRYKTIANLFDRQIHRSKNWDLESIMKNHIHDPDHCIRSLNLCKCCSRHQMNRPTSIDDKNPRLIKLSNKGSNTLHECNCDCRHWSRFTYKAFNNLLDDKSPFSKKWAECESDSESDY